MPSKKHEDQPSKFLTVYEAAAILQLHFRTVVRCCENGTIHAVKLQSRWRIPMSSMDKLASAK